MPQAFYVVDDQTPEDTAMLQALYSRSPASVVTHLEKLKQSGSGKFMAQFYVGYGHASIGDCGTTTCFIEQVSMLVAKAVQDNPLYNGQEASTRYLDFTQQAILDPYDRPETTAIQERWREIYAQTLPLLIDAIAAQRPFDSAVWKTETLWKNTVRAAAFDRARGLLPIGTTTLLSWTTSLRQARDNLRRLKHHPLPEVRGVADSLFAVLAARYPNSFQGNELARDVAKPRDAYAERFAQANAFQDPDTLIRRFGLTIGAIEALRKGSLYVDRSALDKDGLIALEKDLLAARPKDAPLPWRLESYGKYNFLFMLDFGSFRDIQRHRNGVCQVPLIDGRFGMHDWYLSEYESLLGTATGATLKASIDAQMDSIAAIKGADPLLNQYLMPMGMRGLVLASYAVPQTVYVGELRSGKTVHPSLRPIAQKMLQILESDFPFMAVYGDRDAENFTAKRGEQTIVEK